MATTRCNFRLQVRFSLHGPAVCVRVHFLFAIFRMVHLRIELHARMITVTFFIIAKYSKFTGILRFKVQRIQSSRSYQLDIDISKSKLNLED